MFNMQFKSIRTDISLTTENEDENKIKNNNFKLKKKISRSSFLEEKEMTMLKLDANFNKHALFINKINTVISKYKAQKSYVRKLITVISYTFLNIFLIEFFVL